MGTSTTAIPVRVRLLALAAAASLIAAGLAAAVVAERSELGGTSVAEAKWLSEPVNSLNEAKWL